MRRPSFSNLLLPGVLAVLLGIDAGLHIAPLVKGDPERWPVAIDALAAPTTAAPPVVPTAGTTTVGTTTVGTTTVGTTTAPPAPPTTVPVTTALPVVSVGVHDPTLGVLPALVIGDPRALGTRATARVSSLGAVPRPSGWVQSYVRAGGLRSDLMIAVGGGDPRWSGVDVRAGQLGDQPVLVQEVSGGPRRVSLEIGGRPVSLSASGLSDAELTAVLAGLRLQPTAPGAVVTTLPAEMELVASAPGPLATPVTYRANYAGPDWFVELNVDAAAPLVADPLDPAADADVELRTVGDSRAVATEIADAGDGQPWHLVSWWRPDGVHVSMLARGMSLDRAIELAASVRPATPGEWEPAHTVG